MPGDAEEDHDTDLAAAIAALNALNDSFLGQRLDTIATLDGTREQGFHLVVYTKRDEESHVPDSFQGFRVQKIVAATPPKQPA